MKSIFFLLLLAPIWVLGQVTDNDGDWSEKYVTLENTPEAELMVRTGDIDNLGFGWPISFDPFSGFSTSVHFYPWVIDETDPSGTDRIMVISSYNGNPPFGEDGYTTYTSSPDNDVRPITLIFTSPPSISNAKLQLFIDDFQAPIFGSNYQVFIDGIRINDLENLINGLIQTGPIGKMVTYSIPDNLLFLLEDGELLVKFDDLTTGAGDGYAIDFIKLLINPVNSSNSNAHISGVVTSLATGQPIEGVIISTRSNLMGISDAFGNYNIDNITPGLVQLSTYKAGYGSEHQIIDIQTNQTRIANFQLSNPAPLLIYNDPFDTEVNVNLNQSIKLVFDQEIDLSSFNIFSFILSDGQQDISGTFSTYLDTLMFTPINGFIQDKNYNVTITTNLKNIFGIGLDQDIQFSFSTFDSTSSSLSISLLSSLIIFPNPAKNFIALDLTRTAQEYLLINSFGQIIQQGVFSKTIQLKPVVTPGQYLIQLLDQNKLLIAQKQFIKI